MSGQSEWAISVRDANLVEKESGDGYKRLRMDELNKGLSTWTLELDSRHSAVEELIQPGAGIVVRPSGSDRVEMSGFVLDLFLSESTGSPKGDITAVGVCDNILLAKELAYVDPAIDVSDTGKTTYADDWKFYSGPGETAIKDIVGENIGPLAGVVRRRYPFLTIPLSTGLGFASVWRTRFDTILSKCQEIATTSDLTFRMVQGSPGEIVLEVWQPAFVEEARFSIEAHNLSSIVGTFRAPDRTEVIVGGGGEGKARVFTRRTEAGLDTTYGRRAVTYHSRQDTVDLEEMRQSADEDLVDGIATSGITMEVVDLPNLRYGVHYRLGDKVRAVIRGVEISDTIERVHIEHVPGSPPVVKPSIGLPNEEETGSDVATMRRILKTLGVDSRR